MKKNWSSLKVKDLSLKMRSSNLHRVLTENNICPVLVLCHWWLPCTLKTSNGEGEKSCKEYIFCKLCCFEEFCSFCTATAYIGQLERWEGGCLYNNHHKHLSWGKTLTKNVSDHSCRLLIVNDHFLVIAWWPLGCFTKTLFHSNCDYKLGKNEIWS